MKKALLFLPAIALLSACGGSSVSVTNVETGESDTCVIQSKDFVQCSNGLVSTADIKHKETNEDGSQVVTYKGQEYVLHLVDDVPATRQGFLSEAALGIDMNGDGDMDDTVSRTETGLYNFNNYDVRDTAAWTEWQTTSTTTSDISTVASAWSNWSTNNTGNFWEETVAQTRTRTIDTYSGATVSHQTRQCIVTVNGQVDSPAPECDGGNTQDTISSAATLTNSTTETESRQVTNVAYRLQEGTPDERTGQSYNFGKVRAWLNDVNPGTTILNEVRDTIYDTINVDGLEDAHSHGWTGSGSIRILDAGGTHATDVTEIAKWVAPGENAGIAYYDESRLRSNGYFNWATTAGDVGWNILNLSIGVNHWANNVVNDSVRMYNDIASSNPNNGIYVVSAGNDSLSNIYDITDFQDGYISLSDVANVDISVAAPDINPSYEGRFISVGALKDGEIADYSNRAGSAKDWTIFADGTNPFRLDNTGNFQEGTSFAAPKVSGSLAIINHKFPNTTELDRVKIILDTATDLGAPGTDDIYGRGALNLNRALSPVGSLR